MEEHAPFVEYRDHLVLHTKDKEGRMKDLLNKFATKGCAEFNLLTRANLTVEDVGEITPDFSDYYKAEFSYGGYQWQFSFREHTGGTITPLLYGFIPTGRKRNKKGEKVHVFNSKTLGEFYKDCEK